MTDQDQILKTIQELEQQLAQLKQSVEPPSEQVDHAEADPAADTPAPAASEPTPQPGLQQTENVVVGKEGTFDGVFMISDDEKKYQVPPNYISKSQLVIGDRLKIVEMDETGSRYSFKQLTHVARRDVEGILTKKDNQWAVHTEEGTYYVVAAAVKFFGGDIGDKVIITLPDEEVRFPVVWAAFKELIKQEEKTGLVTPTPIAAKASFRPAQATTTPVTPPATTVDITAKVSPPTPPVVQPQFDHENHEGVDTIPAPAVTEGEVHVSIGDDQDTSGEVDLTLTDEQRWELR